MHFGLSAANRRVLTQPEANRDRAARAALLETVREQTRSPESDAVQFAIVRVTPDRQARAVFVSDRIAVASASPSFDPSLDAHAT